MNLDVKFDFKGGLCYDIFGSEASKRLKMALDLGQTNPKSGKNNLAIMWLGTQTKWSF